MPNVMSVPEKLTIVSASVGIALTGAVAIYLASRNRKSKKTEDIASKSSTTSHKLGNHISWCSQLGRSLSQISLRSDDSTDASTVVDNTHKDHGGLNPEQLCAAGLEELDHAIKHWEVAITRIEEYGDPDTLDRPMYQLAEELYLLLERGCRMKEHFEQRVFKTVQTNVAMDAAIQEMEIEYEKRRKRSNSIAEAASDIESFASAIDLADLADLQDHHETHQHLTLYDDALSEITHGSVPCRTLRTKWMNCETDTEFLGKLHCIRLAYQEVFNDDVNREWFVASGRLMVSSLLRKANKNPEQFLSAYDSIVEWSHHPHNEEALEEELRGRGVKFISFYDIVMDFILFDAFDDLESPPSSVKTVIQNRWLSDSFKETALSTACWSILKAKRQMIKVSDGFMAHFYMISEHTSPVLAWGFLGPHGELRDVCEFFKDQVMGLMRDVFSFDKARYTSVEQLAEDIMRLSRVRNTAIMDKLT